MLHIYNAPHSFKFDIHALVLVDYGVPPDKSNARFRFYFDRCQMD